MTAWGLVAALLAIRLFKWDPKGDRSRPKARKADEPVKVV
jgi:hypothetical protein